MSLIAKESGSDFTPAPAGTHVARCIWVIALGTQPSNNPQFVDSYKILLGWELPEESIMFQGEEKPLTITKEYTLSLSDKAALRKDLESWRARQFTEAERKGFDVAKVAGIPCLLTITHQTSAKGKVYAKVSAVSALTKGMIVKPQQHPTVTYDIEDGNSDVFQKLPEWIQKKIQQCEEVAHGPQTHTEEPPLREPDFDPEQVPF